MQVTWMASQTGNEVSGAHTLLHPSTGAVVTGTLAGTVTGTQLTLTETVASGNVPGFSNCSFVGTGTAAVSPAAISGVLTTTFNSCEGFNMFANGSVPAQLALMKK
jgi:hypothetical protein